jgi:hypothetical protein
LRIRFQTPYQYLFVHCNVKHLLLLWRKERKRELYVVEEEGDELLLRYPGETYAERVLDEIEPVFFQRLETDNGPFLAILGATFLYGERTMGMYYHPDRPNEEIYFFEIREGRIHEIDDHEYENVVKAFMSEFPEYFAQ